MGIYLVVGGLRQLQCTGLRLRGNRVVALCYRPAQGMGGRWEPRVDLLQP